MFSTKGPCWFTREYESTSWERSPNEGIVLPLKKTCLQTMSLSQHRRTPQKIRFVPYLGLVSQAPKDYPQIKIRPTWGHVFRWLPLGWVPLPHAPPAASAGKLGHGGGVGRSQGWRCAAGPLSHGPSGKHTLGTYDYDSLRLLKPSQSVSKGLLCATSKLGYP